MLKAILKVMLLFKPMILRALSMKVIRLNLTLSLRAIEIQFRPATCNQRNDLNYWS